MEFRPKKLLSARPVVILTRRLINGLKPSFVSARLAERYAYPALVFLPLTYGRSVALRLLDAPNVLS
jgi:hypothetical protein